MRVNVPHAFAICGLLGIAGLVAAACGGSGSPGVAHTGSTATTTTLPTAAQVGGTSFNYADALKYSECMRARGAPNYPDPTSTGEFLHTPGKLNGQPIDLNAPQVVAADKTCSHLLPNGGNLTPTEQQQALAQALKHATCMRSHGVLDFPDPKTSNGGVSTLMPKDANTPRFQSAAKICNSIAPPPGG